MTERRSVPRAPSHTDVAGWLVRHADVLAWMVPVMFAVLATLAVGIAFTSSVANRALDATERSEKARDRLVGEVAGLRRQNDELVASNRNLERAVAALSDQIEMLGGQPVQVTVEDRRASTSPTPTTTTTQPRPPPTTTTSTVPCRVQVSGRCVAA